MGDITINIEKIEINMKFFKKLFKKFCPCVRGGTGTGCNKYKSIKLVRDRKDVIGVGFHRSGWPYVFSYLETIANRSGILFDDFIEQNFCYKDKPTIYREPWVGVFHHPPTIPYFGNQRENLEMMFQKPEFKESAKHLKLAIALSDHLGDFLKKHLKCPVLVLKHPAGSANLKWDYSNYMKNKKKALVQVGYYLRNTQLISQIPSSRFEKIRLWTQKDWVEIFDERVTKYWRNTRKSFGGYIDKTFVPASHYDDLLSKNIIVMEVFDASASNGVLDCIMRNTPLIINKNPAVVEYLGKDYPLYFENPMDIPLIADRAYEAHTYLKNMDKSSLHIELFIKQIMQAIEKL